MLRCSAIIQPFVRIILLLMAVTLSMGGASAAPRPNIILIVTDDQGYGDFGFTGNPVLETPHLDALGQSSARLSRFYVSPVCSPTRASLMTGRYHFRTRVTDTWVGRSMMEPAEVTVAEALRDAGYRTGIFGKWHLGDNYPMRPLDQGFEVSLIHHGGGLAQPSDPIENRNRYTDPILWRNGAPVQTRGFCTDVFFDAALEFISHRRVSDRPFFAYIAPNAPHAPFHDVPAELYSKYRDKDLSPVLAGRSADADVVARAYAMIENIDRNVGRLLQHLARLDIERETLVLFFTDNGPNTRRYTGPFRGHKSDVYEGGIRAPFFARWPGRLPPGEASAVPAAHIDVMPTLLAAAGASVPAGARLDGRNLLPLLERRDEPWPERMLFIQAHRGSEPRPRHNFAAIMGPWKWLRASGFGHEDPAANVPYELYDVVEDPGETRNLLATHPDVATRFAAAYDAWFADVSRTRPDNFAPPRIVVGGKAPEFTHLTRQEWQRTAGNGWGTQGFWALEAAENCAYTAEAIFREPVSGRVRVRLHGRVVAEARANASTRVSFPPIRFTSGHADLECTLENDGGETTAAYHVLLRRVGQ